VKSREANPEYNSRLRLAIQNAKAARCPRPTWKVPVRSGIRTGGRQFPGGMCTKGRARSGIAVLVETATDKLHPYGGERADALRPVWRRAIGASGQRWPSCSTAKGVFKAKA
jgi:hypothetical protein